MTESNRPSSQSLSWELLDRYLADECTPEERLVVLQTIAAHPDRAVLLSELRMRLQPPNAQSYDVTQRLAELRHLLREDGTSPRKEISQRPSWWRQYVRLPLSLAAVALIAVYAALHDRGRTSTPVDGTKTYTTRNGMFATISLSGGGQIFLAPSSQLTIRTTRTHERRISLTGEARFEITSHANAPVLVQTGAVTTRVLGTTFEVRRYPADTAGRVIVYAGRVAVQGRWGRPTALDAGMAAQFTDSLVAVADFPPNVSTDWSKHQLVFHEAKVAILLATLERWYGYEFKLTDSTIATRHVTGAFPIGESAQMLKSLQYVLGVRMRFDGTVVTLLPNDGAAAPVTKSKMTRTLPSTIEVGR